MNFIILTDSRQQKGNHILKEFDKQGILHISIGLPSADYMSIKYKDDKPYLDYSILIDTKKDLEEISSNLCNSTNNQRIKNEIARAKELGCKEFYFIIGNSKVKTIEDLQNWSINRTKVKDYTLLKKLCKLRLADTILSL